MRQVNSPYVLMENLAPFLFAYTSIPEQAKSKIRQPRWYIIATVFHTAMNIKERISGEQLGVAQETRMMDKK